MTVIGFLLLILLGLGVIELAAVHHALKRRRDDIDFRRLITREGKGPDRRPRI